MNIDKDKFEEWAILKDNFKMSNGILKWFNYDFWLLEKECKISIFKEYLENARTKHL